MQLVYIMMTYYKLQLFTGSQGIMAVNEPIPRAQPEGEVCLRSHNSLATSESLIYLLLIVQVTHPVPRNKTNRNLKVERSPKLARVKFAVSHWISLNLCDDISDIDSYKLLQSSIASFRSTLVHVRFVCQPHCPPIHCIQLLQLVTRQRRLSAAARGGVRQLEIAPPTLFIQAT